MQQAKKKKLIQIGNEEIKLYLFADDIIIHVENLKELTKKLLEPISNYNKVVGHKVIHKSQSHSNMSKMNKLLFILAPNEKDIFRYKPCKIRTGLA